MKKYISLIFLLFIITSCFTAKNNINKENEAEDFIETKKYSSVEDANINTFRSDITLDDIDSLYLGVKKEFKNDLERVGYVFLKNLKLANTSGKIANADYISELAQIDENLKRELNIQFLFNSDGVEQSEIVGTYTINNIDFGSFEGGYINDDFIWIKGIEQFEITVNADGYEAYTVTKNAINTEGSLLFSEIDLEKIENKN